MQTDLIDEDITVAVAFGNSQISREFRCNHLRLKVGDSCVVDTDDGPCVGVVTRARMKIQGRRCRHRLKNVIRKATRDDLNIDEKNRSKELEIYKYARKKIEETELDMKVSCVDVNNDQSHAVIYFTSESRVDYRDVVKSLASELSMKIEMRKMGIRDEAKMMGGCGVCGCSLCCTTFLPEFAPVSIKMAKEQNLSLNQTTISGVCGRLMCCLVYENDFYREMRKKMPRMRKTVITPDGAGRVVNVDYLRSRVTVDIGDGMYKTFNADEVSRAPNAQQKESGPKQSGQNTEKNRPNYNRNRKRRE